MFSKSEISSHQGAAKKSLVLPNVISIGGQRCATTFVEKILADHPEVFWFGEQDALGKVLAFQGVAGVSRLFNGGFGKRIVGEKTPTYSAMYPCEVRQIARLLPKLKIFFTLRNPVDRCWSAVTRYWSYSQIAGQPRGPQTEREILTALDDGLSRRLTNYARTLEVWFASFPRNQIFVNTLDQLIRDPQQFSDDLFNFLEIPTGERPQIDSGRRVNSSKGDWQISPYYRYYLARKWMPMLSDLREMLPDLADIDTWYEELRNTISDGDEEWRFKGDCALIVRNTVNHTLYRPISVSRAVWRAYNMRKEVNIHLRTV